MKTKEQLQIELNAMIDQSKIKDKCIKYLEKRIAQLHKIIKSKNELIERIKDDKDLNSIFRAAAEAACEIHAEENAKQTEIEMLKRMWGAK